MLYWYPKLEELDVNTPETVFVDLDKDEDGFGDCPCDWDNDKVRDAAEEVGGAPVFVRTDHASNKHFMGRASRLPDLEDETIDSHIFEVICHNEMAGFVGLPYKVLAVREWLDLLYHFKAFDDCPIAREIRFFIRDGNVLCSHFYWPKEAIKFYGDTEEPDDWETLYDLLVAGTYLEEPEQMAETVAEAFNGFWSVDLAQTEDGDWYVIDMAKGEKSWHPDCKHKPEREVVRNSEVEKDE